MHYIYEEPPYRHWRNLKRTTIRIRDEAPPCCPQSVAGESATPCCSLPVGFCILIFVLSMIAVMTLMLGLILFVGKRGGDSAEIASTDSNPLNFSTSIYGSDQSMSSSSSLSSTSSSLPNSGGVATAVTQRDASSTSKLLTIISSSSSSPNTKPLNPSAASSGSSSVTGATTSSRISGFSQSLSQRIDSTAAASTATSKIQSTAGQTTSKQTTADKPVSSLMTTLALSLTAGKITTVQSVAYSSATGKVSSAPPSSAVVSSTPQITTGRPSVQTTVASRQTTIGTVGLSSRGSANTGRSSVQTTVASRQTTIGTVGMSSGGSTKGAVTTAAASSVTSINRASTSASVALAACPTSPIVIQRRIDGSNFFDLTWAEMKQQRGSLDGNYWRGLDAIHELTKSGQFKLVVSFTSTQDIDNSAEYSTFTVGDENSGYQLTIGDFSGDFTFDAFQEHNGYKFTTKDRKNDASPAGSNCATQLQGAWWYDACECSACLTQSPQSNFVWQLGFTSTPLKFDEMTLVCK